MMGRNIQLLHDMITTAVTTRKMTQPNNNAFKNNNNDNWKSLNYVKKLKPRVKKMWSEMLPKRERRR